MAKHNRRYKDSVFVDFFGEDKNAKANFLVLYNALHSTSLDASVELEPLRFLQYSACLYERIQNPRNRYLRRLKKIPTPEFYVFYNGEEDYPKSATLRLFGAIALN